MTLPLHTPEERAMIAAFAQQYGRAAARIEFNLTEGALGGLLYRYYRVEHAHLFNVQIAEKKPITIKGDAMVCGDVHVPCTDWETAWKMCQIAVAHLQEPRTLIIAGDFLNLDWASKYPAIAKIIPWDSEWKAGEALFKEWLTVFERIVWTAGNHDRRAMKATGNLYIDDLRKMMTSDKRIETSEWDYSMLISGKRRFRVTHGSEYGVNTGTVGNEMSHKYQDNIILHHQHHGSIGLDRYKRYIVIDNPALVDQTKLGYVNLDSNKRPNMARGFTMVKDGEPTLFLEGLTVWNHWIRKEPELVLVPAKRAHKAA
jgi:predicted phosphodiesterase